MEVILGMLAAVSRLLCLSALSRLTGKWASHFPRWACRVLPDVTFGHP